MYTCAYKPYVLFGCRDDYKTKTFPLPPPATDASTFIVNFSLENCQQCPLRDYYLNNGLLHTGYAVFQKCFLSISFILATEVGVFVWCVFGPFSLFADHRHRHPRPVDKIVTFGGDLLPNRPFGIRVRFIL